MRTGFETDDPAAGGGVLSVSALLRSVRDVLERRFALRWVAGEISNFTRASSGHWYFTLKDEAAQVDCVMFRGRAAGIDWQPREGMRVEARALATLYEPRGRFQLNVETLRQAGLGPLYERFLKLRDRLEREGLFDVARKRDLPAYPRAIGVVTSLAAAALRDVLSALERRNPAIPVIVYPAPVQGEGAAARVAAALTTASARAECDVLLLVRGGGSIEDLWPFNEEVVARAIRAAAIPVVVGVGHETDVTIADFAADRRAATPTAAAELVSPSRDELIASVDALARRAARETRRRIETTMQTIDSLARRLVHPAQQLRASRRHVAHLAARLVGAAHHRIEAAGYRLGGAAPRLAVAAARRLEGAAARLDGLRASLVSLDPGAVLARGYSITRNAAGAVLREATQVNEGERVETLLARGSFESEVRKRGNS
ncbi:MAG: exodeoxyribonuclease VII large subunit [Betaproteobacteria bacterium]|nr:exodeoxyribonuclease VII large subunit [Betaproteobacteria bacterium]